MKREIKFRGLPTCKDNDELDYINFARDGNFAVGFYEDGYIIGKVADANDEYISPEFWVAVDRNTVGQYTGLHDKNGREIYEGDLVQVYRDWIDVVEFRNGSFGLAVSMNHSFISFNNLNGKMEVIGNIFEDGDLIDDNNSTTN